jgi:hypothetical protein
LPATPALLLTQIVRITGKIPEFVLNGTPRAKDVRARFEYFKSFLASDRQLQRGDLDAPIRGLFECMPLEVVKASLGDTKAQAEWQVPYTPRLILFDTSNDEELWDPRSMRSLRVRPLVETTVDPLLLLALLTHLTGESEAQDLKIAALIGEEAYFPPVARVFGGQEQPPAAAGMRRHLKFLLTSPMKARHHARRMLDEMAVKAKSQTLKDAIKAITPSPASVETEVDRRSRSGF